MVVENNENESRRLILIIPSLPACHCGMFRWIYESTWQPSNWLVRSAENTRVQYTSSRYSWIAIYRTRIKDHQIYFQSYIICLLFILSINQHKVGNLFLISCISYISYDSYKQKQNIVTMDQIKLPIGFPKYCGLISMFLACPHYIGNRLNQSNWGWILIQCEQK